MIPRWWRVGVLLERDGAPWTWTFHVRAFTEKSARSLVEARVGEVRHVIYACHASEPLLRAAREEAIAADYGPYRRSFEDPAIARLRRETGF